MYKVMLLLLLAIESGTIVFEASLRFTKDSYVKGVILSEPG